MDIINLWYCVHLVEVLFAKCRFVHLVTAILNVLLLVEGLGHDRHWGSKPNDGCSGCRADAGCNQRVCVGADGVANTRANVCEALDALHGRTDVVVALVALGNCGEMLNSEAALYTEWFDIDEPCKVNKILTAFNFRNSVSGFAAPSIYLTY